MNVRYDNDNDGDLVKPYVYLHHLKHITKGKRISIPRDFELSDMGISIHEFSICDCSDPCNYDELNLPGRPNILEFTFDHIAHCFIEDLNPQNSNHDLGTKSIDNDYRNFFRIVNKMFFWLLDNPKYIFAQPMLINSQENTGWMIYAGTYVEPVRFGRRPIHYFREVQKSIDLLDNDDADDTEYFSSDDEDDYSSDDNE